MERLEKIRESRWFRWLWLVLLVVVLVACDVPSPEGLPCSADEDCDTEWVCREALCQRPISTK